MDWRSLSAVALGILVAAAICLSAAGSGTRPKRPAVDPASSGPVQSAERTVPTNGSELVYLQFPGCPGCERNLASVRSGSGAADGVVILDVLDEKNEAVAEAAFSGNDTHGAVLRLNGRPVRSLSCGAASRERIRDLLDQR